MGRKQRHGFGLLAAVALLAPQMSGCKGSTTTITGVDTDGDGIPDSIDDDDDGDGVNDDQDDDDDNDGIPDDQDDDGDDGDGSSNGDGSGGDGSSSDGDGGDKPDAPPVDCQGDAEEASADTLDFANNLIASPAPPGGLTPENAPMIVVFGFDDVESVEGITFVNNLFGSVTNPDGKKASTNLNPNSCYIRGWQGGGYGCGMGDLALNKSLVTQNKYGIGNHTVDHLESNSMWEGIPEQYKDPNTGSWKQTDDWFGPGVYMDQGTWKDVLMANDTELHELLTGLGDIRGFRAPRLEINDNGLNALRDMNYDYDMDLEELLPETYVDALVKADTGAKKGFNFVPWPYTLDNGSQGIWLQQLWGDKKYVKAYPRGLWEVPVYMLYVPEASGLGKTIADRMLASDSSCTFPADVPEDERQHCFLSEGEINPGDSIKEITAFDFNTFVYSRLKAEEWLALMKHTFLARFYGNRAPLTYGAHPIEYTSVYDSYTITMQANNYGYRDVLDFNTAASRAQAMKDFVEWVKNDSELSSQTYFMSAEQLVDFMKNPFDKDGNPVGESDVASPASNGLFKRVGFEGEGATLSVTDGNTAEITFNVTNVEADPVRVSAGLNEGSMRGVSHIDVAYETDAPFRIRLLTTDGVPSTTVLLAGTGDKRVARIRVQDFFPGAETSSSDLASAKLVDADYMAKVNGIAFESAATGVTGTGNFKATIKQITLHGVETSALCN